MTDLAERYLPGGTSRTTVFVPPAPPRAASGRGSVLTCVDGYRVLDFNNNYTALIHGHDYAPIRRAVSEALTSGMCFGLPTDSEVELARVLSARTKSDWKWRFTNSGTEAVMLGLRLARAHTGRNGIVRISHAYHGSYDAVVGADARGVTSVRDVWTVPLNDSEALRRVVTEHGDEIAAVLIDPMPNRAGLVPLSDEFLRTARTATNEVGALLVVDEIVTYRLSVTGVALCRGVEPDLLLLGKIIGGGLPVGAVGGAPGVMDLLDPRRTGSVGWGGTFNANPVSMSAGIAALEFLSEESISRLNARGDALRTQIQELGYTVTGAGSLVRLHHPYMTDLWWDLWRRGVFVSANGLIALSTVHSDEDYFVLVAALEATEMRGRE